MKRFKGHYPIGIVRTCNGSGMSVAQQRNVLKAIGVKNIFRLGVDPVEDALNTFHRRDQNGDPELTVLVTPFPAVVGKDRRYIFKTLFKLDQALYDLELGRFVNIDEGTADSILYEERCHKQRADYARSSVKNPGRKSLLTDDQWKALGELWCDPEMACRTNETIADDFGISAAALNARFGSRKECIANGKVRK